MTRITFDLITRRIANGSPRRILAARKRAFGLRCARDEAIKPCARRLIYQLTIWSDSEVWLSPWLRLRAAWCIPSVQWHCCHSIRALALHNSTSIDACLRFDVVRSFHPFPALAARITRKHYFPPVIKLIKRKGFECGLKGVRSAPRRKEAEEAEVNAFK